MKDAVTELRKRLTIAVQKNTASGMLFSGGLDTSILAAINPRVKAITVSLKSYGEDIKYSDSVAKLLNMERFYRSVDIDEAVEAIPEVIKITKSFDPAIPNDLPVYFGLVLAKKLSMNRVMTGDGSDELFGGYSFMVNMNDLGKYIQRISQRMRFSSSEMGDFFGIEIPQPFIDKDIVGFALQIPVELKVRQDNGKVWGKWILRKAFEGILPEEFIWQDKKQDSNKFVADMQRFESSIFIDKIFPRLMDKDIPSLSIHDGFFTTGRHAGEVETIVRETLEEQGIHQAVKTDRKK